MITHENTPTTDQRVAIALTMAMQITATAQQTFAAVAEGDSHYGRNAARQAVIQESIGERLLEIAEALSAGTLRIVDESALVHAVAQILPKGSSDTSRIYDAQQIVLHDWKDKEVLR